LPLGVEEFEDRHVAADLAGICRVMLADQLMIGFTMRDLAGIRFATNDEVEPAGEFAFSAQEIACSVEAGRFARLAFETVCGHELDLMRTALALEVQCNRALLDADRFASRAVQDANDHFARRMVDDEFSVVVFVAERDESAAVRADVTVTVIGASLVMIVVAAGVFDAASATGPEKQPRGNNNGTENPMDASPHASPSLLAAAA
jgi:hypothetical protein